MTTRPLPPRPHPPAAPTPGHPIPPPAKAGGHPSPSPMPLTGDQASAYSLMTNYLKLWGLETLGKDLKGFITKGDFDSNTLTLELSQTDAYKKRFAGNALRLKAGLRELTPAEYIGVEEGYRDAARRFGVPASFLDKTSTDKMIGYGVSPDEANDRIQAAAEIVHNAPPEAMAQWNQWYGGGKGGAVAAILDPTKAAPLVEQQARAAEIGATASTQGLSANKSMAEHLASEGVTLDGARKAYGDIAARFATDQAAANRFGMNFSQTDEEKATFDNNAQASQKQNTLYGQEASLFAGHGGGTTATGDPGANY